MDIKYDDDEYAVTGRADVLFDLEFEDPDNIDPDLLNGMDELKKVVEKTDAQKAGEQPEARL